MFKYFNCFLTSDEVTAGVQIILYLNYVNLDSDIHIGLQQD